MILVTTYFGIIQRILSIGFVLILFLVYSNISYAQFVLNNPADIERDPCGFPDTSSIEYKTAAVSNWGYGYDSLKVDLARWSQSPFVEIDSVGATVENRAMYLITIQDTALASPRKRIWIHARTHPGEVQSTWVTNEIIKYLLSSSPLAKLLRDSCIFNIMPMYNPDGVEHGFARQNANGIDIESNWSANTPQPEVQVLHNVFVRLMSQANPIRVALNMHSAYDCKRYFVYHTATGTSTLLASMQQSFIGSVRNYFPGGVEPYTYFMSWQSYPPPTQYPESWFWYNFGDAVLANTYEDKNCVSAGEFDSTAFAILNAIGDYLNIGSPSGIHEPEFPSTYSLEQNFPNPFNPVTQIRFTLPSAGFVSLKIYDLLGKEVTTLLSQQLQAGNHSIAWDASRVASGVYFYKMQVGEFISTKKLVIMR